ncbi:hypothetical protein [Streptomyces sp. NPDC053427]|uniref:hypothetical protein n=1 Tax=Streptomyces sp. NPDC053427 TaxID=3365701 RepID=UPI0037D5001A
MPHPGADTFIRLDKHHDHTSAVTATIVGAGIHSTRALLSLHGFEPVAEQTMVMVGIDREEHLHPHHGKHGRHMGVPVRVDTEDDLALNNRPHRCTWDSQGAPPAL